MTEPQALARDVLMSHPAAALTQETSQSYEDAVARAIDPAVAAAVITEMARMTLMSVARYAAAREIGRERAMSELFASVDRLQEALDDVDENPQASAART
jgi:hypothetical protein